MLFNLKLIDNNRTISNSILQALLPEVSDYLKDAINYLQRALPAVIRSAIINTPEYESILNGSLKYEFGIPDSSAKLSGLLELWSRNVQINYNAPKISNGAIRGSFSANMIRVDFSDVLYSDYAIVYDSLRGYSLPWLEWLLLEGNKTIIKNQNVVLGPSRSSRTGFALMKDSPSSWKVPSEYSGTISDNWITRALDNAEDSINATIEKALDQ